MPLDQCRLGTILTHLYSNITTYHASVSERRAKILHTLTGPVVNKSGNKASCIHVRLPYLLIAIYSYTVIAKTVAVVSGKCLAVLFHSAH